MTYPLISAGECSVCRDAGDAVFVRRLSDGELFFVCPDCGCAWQQRPTPGVVDTIDSPAKFAPDGWTVAAREEIDAAGRAAFAWRECHFNESVFDDLAGFSRRDLRSGTGPT
jgi:hypothetical protein